uniref:Cation-transporting ATPase (EC) n=1 Tax=Ganoderma boninense TaxID=34458 RepID=A0A5K1K614_9APHY|nr:Cation-transporting ATPase (EC [Ganoderma boninense]
MFSVRTWPDDQPPGIPASSEPRLKVKVEGDSHMIEIDSAPASGLASGSGSGFESGVSSGPRLRRDDMDLNLDDRPPSAARAFLDGLRRPLGHAARHLHALGVVSEADLDLICTMPDAWDELGELLTRSGVSVIEWLMVKEAFKGRARLVSAVV